jgi:hypothetical protein
MGRTVVPVRYEIEARLVELGKFVKSLRAEDREHFEKVYSKVKHHISAMSYANPLDPNELMLWSAILELQKEVARLQREANRRIPDEE